MNTVLKNNVAAAEFKSAGGEMVSFKRLDTGCEYVWNGDARYWAGSNPVLFPMICAATNGEIKVGGVKYKLGNHGFARKSEFELVESTPGKAIYKLAWSDATLQMYPFKFELYIVYTLDKNRLNIEYRVHNVDDKDICFQIGGHPGFNCPLDGSAAFDDYFIEFETNETLVRYFLDSANCMVPDKSEIAVRNSNILPLRYELFKDGALVFKHVKSTKVALRSKKTDKSVVLITEGFPYLGVWQPKGAPFVCIEPFHGAAEPQGYSGEFCDKEKMITLQKGKTHACGYTIEIC
ncbi:MAG: aldose 1-epimerase family protein [Christensenellales bacterium]